MNATVVPLPSLVAWRAVADRVGCSRSEAYEHLRACAVRYHGRSPEARGRLLRVTLDAWLRYEQEVLLCGSANDQTGRVGTSTFERPTGAGSSAQRGSPTARQPKRSAGSGSASSPIPIPQRYKPKR